jgi:hypothetical protein
LRRAQQISRSKYEKPSNEDPSTARATVGPGKFARKLPQISGKTGALICQVVAHSLEQDQTAGTLKKREYKINSK